MTEISVLMSVYASERPAWLDRSLQSVWTDQTIKPFEIILVEDGPLGKELSEVIARWKSELADRLVIIRNKKNLGLTKSLNKGIALVNGNYIARMDSDDISMPTRFELQAEYLDKHPDISIVGGRMQEFDKDNDCLNIRSYPLDNDEVLRYIYKASPLAHPTVMMRRALFDNGLTYDERYRTSQDLALWFDALCQGYKISNLDTVTLKFRRSGDVIKRRSKQKAKNELMIYMNGIRRLYGIPSWKYLYPIARYLFRLMPQSIIGKIYGSNLRKRIVENR